MKISPETVNFPAGQLLQLTKPLSSLNLPASHLKQRVAPCPPSGPGEKRPHSHSSHSTLPRCGWCRPGPHAEQLAAPPALVYIPTGHLVQKVANNAPCWCFPAGQFAQEMQPHAVL